MFKMMILREKSMWDGLLFKKKLGDFISNQYLIKFVTVLMLLGIVG